MNIGLVIAGGNGKRMGHDIPKQFIKVNGKSVLIYTLQVFQDHPAVDAIEVVCIDGWHDELKKEAEANGIDKLKWVISGGETGQESIRNGIYNLENVCSRDDTVIIHDGVRPMVDTRVLSNVIDVCNEKGNAVAALPYNEQIFVISDEYSTLKYIPRETLRRVMTPQAYKYGKLLDSYRRAFKEKIGIYGSAYTNTMMVDLGERLFFAEGSDKNIKLTTRDDLELFKGYIEAGKKEREDE